MGDEELGKPRLAASVDFEEWRKNRGVPQPAAPPISSAANEELQLQVVALTKRVELMNAQLRKLEEAELQATLTIDGLQRQSKKKDQEIERLKEECAKLNQETGRRSKMPKLDPDSQLHKLKEQIAQLEVKQNDQAQMIRMMQEDLTMTRSEAQQWRETAHEHSASLSELRAKEKKGLAQFGQIRQERDRAVEKADDLQALVIYHEAKAKEAQRYSEDMSRAVHQQVEALAQHVREAEDEQNRNINPPVGFYRLFRFCKNMLRSLV